MSDNFRSFLRRASPLLAVMGFLFTLNLITDPGNFWSLIPIAAMGIPTFIIFSHTVLAPENQTSQNDQRAAQANAPIAKAESAALDRSLTAQLNQVKTYRQAIDDLAKNAQPIRKDRLNQLAAQFAQWQGSIEKTAQRIASFRTNAVVQQDLKSVPQSIQKLEAELANEKSEAVRAQLTSTLQTRRTQLAALDKLQSSVRQAEIQLESTIASMGTIYSQVLANQSTSAIGNYAHLSADVSDQVRALDDQLQALEEVRLRRNNLS